MIFSIGLLVQLSMHDKLLIQWCGKQGRVGIPCKIQSLKRKIHMTCNVRVGQCEIRLMGFVMLAETGIFASCAVALTKIDPFLHGLFKYF